MSQPTKQQTTDAIVTIAQAMGWRVIHESNPSSKRRHPSEPACMLLRDDGRLAVFYVTVKGRLNQNEAVSHQALETVAADSTIAQGFQVFVLDYTQITEVPQWLA